MISDEEVSRLKVMGDYDFKSLADARALDRITRIAQLALETPMAAISVVERDKQWFISRQGLALCETARRDSFCSHVVARQHSLFVPDAALDERFRSNPYVTGDPHIRFYVGVPIHTLEGKIIGALCTLDTEPRVVTEHQLDILSELAGLVEDQFELNRLAAIDDLTGALRRSAFLAEASRDFVTMVAGSKALSCLVLDIDCFKAVNDSYGHLIGDCVLKVVGEVLNSSLRSADFVGRIGGEEFAVVLPGAPLEDAVAVAERIRTKVKKRTQQPQALPSVTVSVGVAAVTLHDRTFTHLLARADRALYRAKGGGRDKVEIDVLQ